MATCQAGVVSAPRPFCVCCQSAALLAAAAQQVTAQTWSSSCSTKVQRISCYYDAAWAGISGVVMESEGGGVQTLCRGGSSPGTVIDVPEGVGISAVAVTATTNTRRVVQLEFR